MWRSSIPRQHPHLGTCELPKYGYMAVTISIRVAWTAPLARCAIAERVMSFGIIPAMLLDGNLFEGAQITGDSTQEVKSGRNRTKSWSGEARADVVHSAQEVG